MKTKIKNCVFWVLGVSFLFLSSCQKDDLELETKSHQHLKVEFISKDQLLNELKNPNVLDFVRNNLFHSIEQNKLLRTNETNNLFQKIVLPEYTTYTYKIDYYNPLEPIIKYFIITKDKNGIEKACYLNYTPSNYTYKLDLGKFSGKLEMFTVENELYSSTVYLNGKPFKDNDPNKIQYQTEVCFSSTTITLVTCSQGGGHGVGGTCNDGSPSDAFYSVSTTMTCIDTPGVAYIAAPSQYGGGGGGGNGFEGIPIPTPYQGEPDLGNAEWVFASQVGIFTNSLPGVVQNVLTQNWWLFPNIVQWFKDNGFTQQNKLAIANAILKLDFVQNTYNPNATVIEINQLHYFAFIFFANNPTTTLPQFQNWFMGKAVEIEDNNSLDLNTLNLSFATQNPPTFDDFLLAYPSHTDPNFITPLQLYTSIGGAVLTKYNQGARNTCALRVSKGLNDSGVIIPNIPGVTVKGGGASNKYYFLVASNLLYWMKNTFGVPTGNNHLMGSQGGANGENFPSLLTGKEGIYIMIPNDRTSDGFDASGHADLFFNGMCDGDCYFNAKGGVKDIFFFELN